MKIYLVITVFMVITQPIYTDSILRKFPLLPSLSKRAVSTNTSNTSSRIMSPVDMNVPASWSPLSQMFYKAIEDLGLFKMKDVALEKLPKKMIHSLKKAKNQIIVLKDGRGTSANGTKKRHRLHDFCQEYFDRQIVLAHENEQLAYVIKSVRCQGVCFSNALNLVLGECVLKRKRMVVYIMDKHGGFAAKIVEPGCACECLHYKHFV